MRDDLLPAQACVDWTVAQLPALAERINTWLRHNTDHRIEKTEPPITHSPIVAGLKRSLPLDFNVEVGAYINTLRSSLDILATALFRRHGIGRPDDAYFPVARSADEFAARRFKGSKLVKGLPDRERACIEALKPYKGGNESLFALHQLDIMRKHRRLLGVKVTPKFTISATAARGLHIADFRLFGTTMLSADQETILGFISNRASDYDIEFAPQVALDEPSSEVPPEIIAALYEFASLANSIIKLFDS